MSRLTELALACYPPSWRERYGQELRDLAGDGDTADLLVGAARAWLHPAGERTASARRLSAISTVHVSWCLAFLGATAYLKAIDDPPVRGLTTGASQPLWAVVKASFSAGWLVVLLTGTALLLRIGVPAIRRRDWHVLRPLLPGAGLLVVVAGTAPFIGSHGAVVILMWLALGVALVVAGAVGPVVALRRSGASDLRMPSVAATVVAGLALLLAVAAAAQAAVLSAGLDLHDLTMMWAAVCVLAACAASSSVSVGRALRRA